MVGRLIQEHNVGRREQKLAESHPRLLASGQCIHRLVEFLIGESQAAQHARDLALPGVAARLLEAGLGLVIALHQSVKFIAGGFVHLKFHAAKAVLQVDHMLHDLCDLFVDGTAAGEHILLGQVSDGGAFGERHFTLISCLLTDDDLQKSGLACAVDADDSCLLMFFYMK